MNRPHPLIDAWSRIRDAGLLLISPTPCRLCSRIVESHALGVACRRCWEAYDQASALYRLACARCGRLRRADADLPPPVVAEKCDQCLGLPFQTARSCGPYLDALRTAVLGLKKSPVFPEPLRKRLRASWDSFAEFHTADRLIPVPLAPRRLLERGYNQAELIAREIQKLSQIQVDSVGLRRVKETERHRFGMDAVARRKSVGGAFQVARPKLIADRQVLLIDDVFTSGATIEACVRALLDAGAERVNVLTLARTPRTLDR